MEQSAGELELPASANGVSRSAPTRLVRAGGTIRDTLDGATLGGARIELVEAHVSARSREDGHFQLGPVPRGKYTLRVTRIGYEPITIADVRFPEDVEQAPIGVLMRRGTIALSEVIVTPGHFGLLQNGITGSQSLSREQLETIPQLGEDIYRAVSRLPGVSADDFSAKFSVRGGSGDELYVSLDGLELVEPFHLKDVGGAFSIIDIQTLGTASLSTGGFSAEYGDRLTGVFTLKTSDPRTDGVHGSVGVSAMNARTTLQGGFAGGKGGWLVSARPGYLDVALKFTEIADSIQPRYYDLFAKAQYDLPGHGRIAVHALRANDSFRFLKKDEPNIFSNYGSSYGWLTWDDEFVGGRLRMQSVFSSGALSWQRHGENYTTAGVQTASIDDSRSLRRVGVRQDWTFDATPRLMFKWGVDAKRESAAYEYLRLLGVRKSTGYRAGRDSVSTLLDPRADKLALYFAPRVQVLPSLIVEAGARFDRSSLTDESIVSPRLNVSWQPLARTAVRAAWGGYSQSQPLFSLQAEDGVSSFERAERAEQRTLGVEQSLPKGIVARVEGYERRLTHARGRYMNLGGDMWLFPELLWDRKLVERTAGRDRGIELQLARSDAERTDWSVGYALSSSTDVVEGRTVPRAFDQRHAVHVDWSLHPRNNSWRLSVGGLWHSGWPYTPTNLMVDTVKNTATDFAISTRRTPDALNSARLRSYHRVDVRWTKYFHTQSGRLAVFGEVYNLLGTVNPRGYWRDATVKDRQVTLTTGEINQWPRLPVAGFSWQF
ncbi:MAG: carboxypeptidase regulatory-like domain-containing protein [Gemmatimonadaceae bacterium]